MLASARGLFRLTMSKSYEMAPISTIAQKDERQRTKITLLAATFHPLS